MLSFDDIFSEEEIISFDERIKKVISNPTYTVEPKMDGLSGFPKTNESVYDSENVGHSSTSISFATGLARARDIKKHFKKLYDTFLNRYSKWWLLP